MKSVLLIGAGRFGYHLAIKLKELGHEVLAIDNDEERLKEILPFVTKTQIGDATKESFIASLGVEKFDLCFVTTASDFQKSLEITSLVKDYGARIVISRAASEIHVKFLLRNGADEIIYPEREMAYRSAIRYSSDHVFDYIELTPEHAIYETQVPESWIGRSIIELKIRQEYGIHILAIKDGRTLNSMPTSDYVFKGNEALVILGTKCDIQQFLRLS